MFMNAKFVLSRNKFRYLALFAGFFLFVAPFALLSRVVYYALGNVAEPDLHTICMRMPLDWIFGGKFYQMNGSVMAAFVVSILIIAIFVGPIFCGWLCPVGAVSEAVSRILPIPKRLRISIKDTNVTMGLRYGFLAGFIAISMLLGLKAVSSAQLSTVCCRYCASSVLQNVASAIFGEAGGMEYWFTGSIIVLVSWLLIGGIFMVGGRGWCLFFCPLGALSNLIHKAGSKLGFFRTEFDPKSCRDCHKCVVSCPMWAIKEDGSIESGLCINCKECENLCLNGAYKFKRGKAT